MGRLLYKRHGNRLIVLNVGTCLDKLIVMNSDIATEDCAITNLDTVSNLNTFLNKHISTKNDVGPHTRRIDLGSVTNDETE